MNTSVIKFVGDSIFLLSFSCSCSTCLLNSSYYLLDNIVGEDKSKPQKVYYPWSMHLYRKLLFIRHIQLLAKRAVALVREEGEMERQETKRVIHPSCRNVEWVPISQREQKVQAAPVFSETQAGWTQPKGASTTTIRKVTLLKEIGKEDMLYFGFKIFIKLDYKRSMT